MLISTVIQFQAKITTESLVHETP